MVFDHQQLETFAVVVELRHFGRAASALNSMRIRWQPGLNLSPVPLRRMSSCSN
ncbi:hypothetical protein P3T23_005969 [Paraburkholderia sp. GAS448]|uniref:hypothetical protein n=1 Tax=Paraburkholderia sp. GAS448 TaxID=3035136 RepID=UPI003D235C29